MKTFLFLFLLLLYSFYSILLKQIIFYINKYIMFYIYNLKSNKLLN